MTEKHVGEILISRRTVRIGHQVYPLANISRVQTLRVVWGGKLATWYPLREILVLVVVVGALAAVVMGVLPGLGLGAPFDVEEMGLQVVVGASVLAGARVAWLLGVLVHRLLRRQTYTLVIETAGTQYTVLSGTEPAELDRVKGEIVNAIENPPTQDRVVHLSGDVVFGDKIGRDKHAPVGGRNMTFTG